MPTLKAAGPRGARTLPPRNYARWRALSLSLVYVLFAIHILHWKITGRTLAPLELNEVMYTLELGVITAGFIFMCLLVLGTLLFGRFFCSWACHILVLQDLCAWALRKVGIRAKPFRSRLLLVVPPAAAFYMFVWPQLVRAWQSRALPTFHWATDRDGWASLVTENFWRNLPGPWITAITFIVCGFLTVYLLGSRTFCTYVCPYGALFGLADRFSPGRIRVSDACRQCGTCTAACTSGIRVHEEVQRHGMIVNPACLKDFDCVSACPQGALSYGLGKPALLRSLRSGGRFGRVYDFSLKEEVVAGSVFVVTFLSFRGLYATVPFLLSLTIAVLVGFLTVQVIRLQARPNVRMGAMALKARGRVRAPGLVFLVFFSALTVLIAHSGFIRYYEFTGLRAASRHLAPAGADRLALAQRAYERLEKTERYGLFRNHNVQRALALAAFHLGRFDETLERARGVLARVPGDVGIQLTVARSLCQTGRIEEARKAFSWIAAQYGDVPALVGPVVTSLSELGTIAAEAGDFDEAVIYLRDAVAKAPGRAALRGQLAEALAEAGRLPEAARHLRLAVELDPGCARSRYNLGTLLLHGGDGAGAIEQFESALDAMAGDADLLNNLGSALLIVGRVEEARLHLTRAVQAAPGHAGAHFNLARALVALGDGANAEHHLRIAAELDARYVEFVGP